MSETRDQIVSGILRARAELEGVLYEMEKLPAVSESTIHFAAHALNNFLTVTGGTVELLQASLADHPDPQVHTGLEVLLQTTNLMTHAVSQIMNVSIDREVRLRFERLELPVLVQRFCGFYQRLADRKGIRLLSSPANDIPPVWTDRVTTAAVLDNLFSNAVKFSPPGTEIRVQVTARDEEVVFTIRDEGPGLSREDQAKLFQRGVPLTPRPTGGEVSTGYGLAVAREFSERLGGSIWCESVLGQGAAFFFRLPRYREQT
jgi:signal transduction histidine kinase